MMRPYDVRRYIARRGVPYGQDVFLPGEIDTRGCQKFFGTRCAHNVHVTGRRRAHIDRVDPRKDPIGHLKEDVGISYTKVGVVLGAIGIGAILVGMLLSKA